MRVVYAGQPFPDSWRMAVFLAGPTPRSAGVPSWRPEALDRIRDTGFDGVVFVPEAASGERLPEYDDQVEWERQGLNFADRILFWVPRDLNTLPGLTTNVEFGLWCGSGKAVLGYPPSAPRTKYLGWLAEVEGVAVYPTLAETLAAALEGWAGAPERSGGERHVPLHVWQAESFQRWYRSLRAAGNRLEEARLLWSAPPPARPPFAWVLWARVWVAAEGRCKANEWVFTRTDVSCVVLYHRPPGRDLLDADVVLVREFRTPARTPDGFLHELPGGSSHHPSRDPRDVAVEELREETGLHLSRDRLRPLGSRQAAGTLSSHHAHAFAVEATAEEMDGLRRLAAQGEARGVGGDSERTYVEVVPVREILQGRQADWATLGVVMQALLGQDPAGAGKRSPL
jgi:8-oxo-dGTP pyrophosphatase MutT (NUDIX family)